ncbi:hypothetical protein MKX01_033021 [Papaver californicum]|nr:hypothetical protein MKX01_033021 [Papaver californicum]
MVAREIDTERDWKIPTAKHETGLTHPPIMRDFRNTDQTVEVKSKYESNSIVRQALFLLIMYILFGAIVYSFNKKNFSGIETHPVVDAIYFCIVTSFISATTVGSYGGNAFNTLQGRLFASLWLLVSTLSVARAFLYLAELRIDKRHRSMAKWILHKQITLEDLLAADINNSSVKSNILCTNSNRWE